MQEGCEGDGREFGGEDGERGGSEREDVRLEDVGSGLGEVGGGG